MINARKLAVKALIDVEKNGAYSNITLNKYLSENEISNTDKAFASALFYGVLDRKITLEYILSSYIKTPVKKILPYTKFSLFIALYQILYMDKIPNSAAVDESVKIVKSSKERFNSAFVNGVLRNILRSEISLPQYDSVKSIGIRYSCPEWIINSFIADYGKENAVALLEKSVENPPVTLKVNTVKITPDELVTVLKNEGINSHLSDFEGALNIDGSVDIGALNSFKNGFFHVQDLASQKSISMLGLKPGYRVLDLCAAPGGKSFTSAEYMENNGEILAFDIYEKRAGLIKKGAERLGLSCIKANTGDATVFNEALGIFDAVICDVPCSGLGVIRRKPEIKYKNIEDFSLLSQIQSKILLNAAKYLKPGGKLLYSTCTLRKAENEDIINAFLDKVKGYELKYEHNFMPHIDGTDGFYCAIIQKAGDLNS